MERDGSGTEGSSRRQPTMADLAAHLGVSRQLVSIVLRDAPGASEETRRRVKQAAEEYGFAAHAGAQSLRRTRSRDLGVVFAPAHSTEPEIVEAIYPAAVSHGYDVILSAHTDTRTTQVAVEELLEHRCAALILIGSDLNHRGLIEIAQRSHVPVVDVGYGRRNDSYDVVRSTGDRGIADMVDHLAGLGHRDIAYVDAASMPMAALRRRGYDRATKRLGIGRDVTSAKGDYTQSNYFEEVGAEVGRILLRRSELPTALVCPNDHTAVGLLQVLARNGVRVPEDVSLTGFDDAPIARLSSVDLTTVRQDAEQMGVAAVEAAVRRIETTLAPPKETVIETSLVLRGSSAPPTRR